MHRLKRVSAIKLAAVSGFLDVGVSAGYFFAAIMFSRSVSGPVWSSYEIMQGLKALQAC